MLKPLLTLACVLLVFALALSLQLPGRVEADEADHHGEAADEPELAVMMAWMQRWSMKLGYAIDAKNIRLADFYMHEMEEQTEKIIDEVPVYEDLQIALQTRTLFAPALEPLEQAISQGNWDAATQRYAQLIDACNRCHTATKHDYIVITVPRGRPPYNQAFAVP